MRPDIEEYLREQGWVFAGVSQPDHKRQWAQMDGDKVKRVALESELEDLALEIVGSPFSLDELAEKYSENILANNEDLQDAIADAYKAGWRDREQSKKKEMRFQVAVSCIQGIIEAKLGIIGEIAPEIAVKESLRIADEFVRQWFDETTQEKPHWKPNEFTLSLVKKVADGKMLTHLEQMSMITLYDNLQKLI